MSAEVIKKRGRPKKVISDPIEIKLPEKKKSTTRAKSTKAASKPVKTTPILTTKAAIAPAISNSAGTASTTTISAQIPSAPASPPKAELKPSTAPPSKPPSKPPVTPETSKILKQVREVSAKGVPVSQDSPRPSRPAPKTISASPSAPPPKTSSVSPKTPSPTTTLPPTTEKPISTSNPSQIPPVASKPPPKISLAALNSEIVSNISSRAGAKLNAGAAGKLPPNYKSAARRWTAAVVAMPILIVTSYVLYERLVLGEEKKVLVRPGLTEVEAPGVDTKGEKSSIGILER